MSLYGDLLTFLLTFNRSGVDFHCSVDVIPIAHVPNQAGHRSMELSQELFTHGDFSLQ